MNAKKLVAVSAVAFSVALAVVVGNRMSAEAMAVVIGVVCGVAASIPTSALMLAMARRSRPAYDEGRAADSRPPVVVVAPGPVASSPAPAAAPWPAYAAPPLKAPREYHIVGDEPL